MPLVRTKAWAPLAAVLVIVAAVLVYRDSRLRGIPAIGHPFDVETLGTINIDPAQNAFADYEQANSLLVTVAELDPDEIDRALGGPWSDAPSNVKRWLEDNRDALKHWRAGTQKGFYLRIQPAELSNGGFADSVSEALMMMRLASLAAARSEAERNLAEAWRWHRAMFRFSRHRGMFDTSIDRMVGASLHALAVKGIVRWAGHEMVTDEELNKASKDVLSDYAMTASPSATIRADYFSGLHDLSHLDQYRDAHRVVAATFGLNGRRIPEAPELFLANEPEFTRRLLQHQVANLLTFVDSPSPPPIIAGDFAYYDALPAGDSTWLSPDAFRERLAQSELAQNLLWKSGVSPWWRSRELARQRMLEVALAAEAYRRERGEFPTDVSELIQAHLLSELPIDPTSPIGTPIRYERDSMDRQRAKLWTMGQNGIDDGGSLSHIPGKGTPNAGFLIGMNDANEDH